MPTDLIIIGASARAAAQSALRAGHRPWCIDLFADRDLRAIATVKRCPAEKYPHGVLELLRDAPRAPVLFTGAMENHLPVVEAVALNHELVGAGPEAMRISREPETLATMSPAEGLGFCRVRRSAPLHALVSRFLPARWAGGPWVTKPLRSAGGRGVRDWSPGDRVEEHHYLQQHVAGTPISAVYVADGWTARLLGATEQIIGDTAFGASGYQYVGNLVPAALGEGQRMALRRLGVALTQRCDLRGVFGVDAVLDREGVIWPVEINPRYTASVELIEAAHGIAALEAGASQEPASRPQPVALGVRGKAIVFAKEESVVPDLYEHFEREQVADVPEPGDRIGAGRAICTLFAAGPDREACLARLRERAEQLYTRLRR